WHTVDITLPASASVFANALRAPNPLTIASAQVIGISNRPAKTRHEEPCGEGQSWCPWARGGIDDARLCARDGLGPGAEMVSLAARVDGRQQVIHGAKSPSRLSKTSPSVFSSPDAPGRQPYYNLSRSWRYFLP